MNKNDIYSHLMKGGDPQVLLDAFLVEMNEAQKKVNEQKELEAKKKEEEAAKRAAAKENKEKKEAARKTAIAALKDYFTLVCPSQKTEALENYAKLTIDTMSESMNTLDKIKVSVNGQPWDWLKMLTDITF